MITNPVELAAQIAMTAAFIDADPETITLIPRTSQKTAAGGRVWVEGTPRTPQTFKVTERVSTARIENRVPGGEQREDDMVLIGLPDAVIEAKDIFSLRGSEWEVIEVQWDNGYEKRASVRRYGR